MFLKVKYIFLFSQIINYISVFRLIRTVINIEMEIFMFQIIVMMNDREKKNYHKINVVFINVIIQVVIKFIHGEIACGNIKNFHVEV